MRRVICGFILVLLVSPLALAQEGATFPAKLQKQIDESVIGEWTYEGSWGEKKFSGEDRSRWTARKTAVLSVGFEMANGKRVNYVNLMGWDGEAKKLVHRGFNSNGETWSGEWSVLTKTKWTGKGAGLYDGKKWESAATLEFKKDWQRYEDVTDGKPWIAVSSRKAKTEK